MRHGMMALAAAAALAASAMPAVAQAPGLFWFLNDRPPPDGSLPSAGSRQYGDDVVARGPSPDQPHWHGDSAVPLGLRWHDTAWEGTAAEAPPVGVIEETTAAAVAVPRPKVVRLRRPVKHVVRRGPVCVPTRAHAG